jgi:hypothetical protein
MKILVIDNDKLSFDNGKFDKVIDYRYDNLKFLIIIIDNDNDNFLFFIDNDKLSIIE